MTPTTYFTIEDREPSRRITVTISCSRRISLTYRAGASELSLGDEWDSSSVDGFDSFAATVRSPEAPTRAGSRT